MLWPEEGEESDRTWRRRKECALPLTSPGGRGGQWSLTSFITKVANYIQLPFSLPWNMS